MDACLGQLVEAQGCSFFLGFCPDPSSFPSQDTVSMGSDLGRTGTDRCWSLGWGAGPQAGLLKGVPKLGHFCSYSVLQLAEQGTGVADWSWDQPGTRRPDLAVSQARLGELQEPHMKSQFRAVPGPALLGYEGSLS